MSDQDWVSDPTFKADDEWVSDPAFKGDEKASPLMSAARKGSQGLSAGFSDEIAGFSGAGDRMFGGQGDGTNFGLDPIAAAESFGASKSGPTLDWEILRDAYRKARDKEREALKKDSKDNPVISATAEIAGAIASPLNKIMPSASLAKQGAVIGGVTGLGNSESEDLSGVALDTAKGAGLGGVLGKVADEATPYIEKGVKKIGEGASDLAERFAARALGAERGTIKKLGQGKVQDIGRYALDEGLLTPLASTDDVIARNMSKQAQGGQMMDDVYSAVDNAGASTFNPLEVASKVDESIGGFYRSPINRGEANQLENTLESMLMRGDKNIPLKEAQALKQEIGKVANWKNNLTITDKEKMAREAYSIVSKAIDDAAETGAQSIGKEGLGELLTSGKKLFGSSKGAEELLTNKLAREQGNKLVGLTDAITGGGALGYGGMTGDWETAGAIMLGKKGLEKYGAQTAALGLNKISKSLLKSPQMLNLYQKNPQAFQSLVQKLETNANVIQLPKAAEKQEQTSVNKDMLLQKTQGTKYQKVLQDAAAKSEQSLAAAHFVLAGRDSDYRKTIEGGE